jgi:hypothetical protein
MIRISLLDYELFRENSLKQGPKIKFIRHLSVHTHLWYFIKVR